MWNSRRASREYENEDENVLTILEKRMLKTCDINRWNFLRISGEVYHITFLCKYKNLNALCQYRNARRTIKVYLRD